MTLAEEVARRSGGVPVILVPGQVVVTAGVASVNIGGGGGTVRWNASFAPVDGDAVLVALQGSEAWVVCRTTATARPDTGTVQTVPGGDTITVNVGGASTSCRFVAAYAPVVGDLVYLSWQSSQPVVLGKVGTVAGGVAPPPPPAPPGGATSGTSTFAAIESRSWQSGGWRTSTDDVIQGDTAEYPGHPNSGAWFYGSAPQSLAGATVTSARVWMRGRSAEIATPTVHIYRHTSNTRPGGDVARVAGPSDVARDDKAAGWVAIPAAFAQAIVDTGGGIAITGEPYTRIWGLQGDPQSGALEITWRR